MRIYSIFRSIQGEVNSSHQGRLATFIRVAGCNLRCSYCDSMYAVNSPGKEMTIEQIYEEVMETPHIKSITITGGEPLLYEDELIPLVKKLAGSGFEVNIETNGSKDLPLEIRDEAAFVFDYKLPSSGEYDKMTNSWFKYLDWCDWVKFVIMTGEDLATAMKVEEEILMFSPHFRNFAYSPVWDNNLQNHSQQIVNFLLYNGKGFETLNLQIHKCIWEENNGKIEH